MLGKIPLNLASNSLTELNMEWSLQLLGYVL